MYSVLLLEKPVFLISFLDRDNNFLESNLLPSLDITKRRFFIVLAALAEICWLIIDETKTSKGYRLIIKPS